MEKELFGAGAGRRRFELDVKDRGYHHHGLGILSYIYPTYILTGFMFDLGFLGVEKTFLNKNHHYLSRRSRLRASCRIEKDYNKNHSAKRIVVEHVMPSAE
jgi:hypothetical protein